MLSTPRNNHEKPRMKVAFVNNMNNNFFSIVRHMRDAGVDAHLFIFDEIFDGFFPQSDTFEDVSTMDYIHVIAQITFKDFFNPFSSKVKKALARLREKLAAFDLVVACGFLAFFERANIVIDVFMPYGGDVYQLTDLFNYSRKKYFPYSVLMRYIMHYQRKAIQRTRVIASFATQDIKIKKAIQGLNRRWIDWNMAMIYVEDQNANLQEWDFLKVYDFVIFSHIRHTWQTGTDYNGNDRAIRAYAEFLKQYCICQNPIFVMFEYGCDVPASKQLIAELGIEKQVRWVPIMQRKYIYAGLRHANVVMGIFNCEVISSGGVTYEAFSCGVPVIGNAKVTVDNNAAHNLPLIHAFEVPEIVAALDFAQKNPEKLRALGLQSRRWFDHHLGKNLIQCYITLMQNMIQHKQSKLEDAELCDFCENSDCFLGTYHESCSG